MSIPETRASLILRLSDATDVEAWDEFVAIYEPLVYRLARRKGFQHADAQEFVQEVMLAVSRAVERWVPDPEKGKFRHWLFRVARNLMINFLTRRKYQPLENGHVDVEQLMTEKSESKNEVSTLFNLEFQREVFQWAACQVKDDVKQNTWDAFWLSSVEGLSINETADRLDMTIGSIYIARSRVIFRLRERVKEFTLSTGFDIAEMSEDKNR